MKFDARAAKQMQAGAHMIIDGCPGLRLIASATRRTWAYRYKSPVTGQMKQVKIGEWPAMSVAAATVAWEDLRAARDGGADPAAERRVARATGAPEISRTGVERWTVREICSVYMNGHVLTNRKEKSAREVRRMFDTMLGSVVGEDARKLTRQQAFDLIASHEKSPVVARKLKAELGAAWDYALDAGRLPESTQNWWRRIMKGKLRSAGREVGGVKNGVTKRVLSRSELCELICWLPNFSETVRDVLTIYLWTGTRGGEICAMEGREVVDGPHGMVWTIPKSKTKNADVDIATDHRVPIIGRAAEVVRRRKERFGAGFLFPTTPGRHTSQKTVQEAVHFRQPYCASRPRSKRERLPVTYWAPHDLRRSVRTLLSSIGCPHEIGEAILGHVTPGVAGIYQLYKFDAERFEWLMKLSAELERLAAANLKIQTAGEAYQPVAASLPTPQLQT